MSGTRRLIVQDITTRKLRGKDLIKALGEMTSPKPVQPSKTKEHGNRKK